MDQIGRVGKTRISTFIGLSYPLTPPLNMATTERKPLL